MTNTELLEQRIKDSGLKKSKIISALGLTYSGFLKKVNGITEFKASEIKTLCDLLRIDNVEEQSRIFFADEGEKNSRSEMTA